MYKHIIWDFDGTLFDTYPALAAVFQTMLKERGLEEPFNDIFVKMKISMYHAKEYYEDKFDLTESFFEEYKERKRIRELEISKPYDCIPDICKQIAQAGKFNYVYTHRGNSTNHFLKKYYMNEYFTEIVTSQYGFERKPGPEGILYLVNKYHMDPNEAIMIGDRELDILSGKNAGIQACFYSEGGNTCKSADYTIKDLKELYALLNL
jgi:HAD superfamily hydrolase (TIGR01549 family)